MYYGSDSGGTLDWKVGKKANFSLKGTDQTSTGSSSVGWFMVTNFIKFNLAVAQDGILNLTTGGGPMNLNTFQNIDFPFADGAQVDIKRLGTRGVISGMATREAKVIFR
ncbi:hypothetical protein HU830_04750 [Lactobacillus sp. DCY120]|uniref:Uncharacterized protein n=1 Tax=Bombilactobacillus apium TaxID=2675299 RepID=A0A850R0A4_9LACO|nr:hypothetical protein [Bombilactobacillus apium]NVY96479.1 hypothetical protein [Bombilactobacillus apium]